MTSFVAFQFRRGLSTLWTSTNTVLAPGEPGVELDTGRFKVGDGSTSWSNLPYFSPGPRLVCNTEVSTNMYTLPLKQGLYTITGHISDSASLIADKTISINGFFCYTFSGNRIIIQSNPTFKLSIQIVQLS